jgi:hypothetical protein
MHFYLIFLEHFKMNFFDLHIGDLSARSNRFCGWCSPQRHRVFRLKFTKRKKNDTSHTILLNSWPSSDKFGAGS